MVISYSFPSFHPHVPFYLFFFIFFSWFFLHHTRIPLSPPTLLFLFLFLDHSGIRITCVVASRTRAYLHFSLSVSFSFFLFLLHKHTNFSPSISHKQILSHTHIDLRQRSGDWRSTQIGVLHFFIFFGLISFILLLRFH